MGFEPTTPRDVIGFYGTFWDSSLEYDEINLPPYFSGRLEPPVDESWDEKPGCSLWSNMSMNYHQAGIIMG